MSVAEQVDVVVVGAGMVGVALANAIAPSGLSIAVLEQRAGDPAGYPEVVRKQQENSYDPRVSALTCASQQLLTHVGAWPLMQGYRVAPYTDMDVWDGQGTGHIHFSAQALHEPVLGHIVENRVTLAALYEVMGQHDNIRFNGGVELVTMSEADHTGARTLSLSDGRTLVAKLVVAADGALSRTRQLANIPMWEFDYGHHAIVTTIKTERGHQSTAWQRFTEDGPLAILPLSDADGDVSSIVWSTSPAHARDLMELDDQAFAAALAQAFEHRLGEVRWVDQRHLFPLRQRHAKYYVRQSFALIGDAAHTIHPLAGQGVNLGLLDAAALAEVILDACERGEAFGSEAVLRRFQRARRSGNLQMSAAMEGFKRLFNEEQPVVRLARNFGMSLLDRLAPVKNHIVLEAMGLRGDLPRLARRPIRS